MLNIVDRSMLRLSTLLLLIISMTALAVPAAAFDGPQNKEGDGKQSAPATTTAPQTLNISYALYNDSIGAVPTAAPKSPATMPPPPAVSTAPMTAGEKFKYWAKSSFFSPGAYGLSLFSGLFNEAIDDDKGKPMTAGNYFPDALTRAARSFAFRATSGFFEKFAYATIFKQDPRYHRSDKKGAGGKIAYAVSRLFVTQGDRCGCDQFNISFLAGGLTAGFIANAWDREERRDTRHAFTRWTTHLGLTALSNILKEFIGGQ